MFSHDFSNHRVSCHCIPVLTHTGTTSLPRSQFILIENRKSSTLRLTLNGLRSQTHGAGVGVDSAWEQEKTEASLSWCSLREKCLKTAHAKRPSVQSTLCWVRFWNCTPLLSPKPLQKRTRRQKLLLTGETSAFHANLQPLFLSIKFSPCITLMLCRTHQQKTSRRRKAQT
jgi:hypothetical protein